jgi:hypothetical protein
MDKQIFKKLHTPLRNKQGSTLIWALVATIILGLIITSIFAITATTISTTKNSQIHTQAYYTAQSINDRIATWLTNIPYYPNDPATELNPDDDPLLADFEDQYDFIQKLIVKSSTVTPSVTMNYTQADLGSGMGSATTSIEFEKGDTDIDPPDPDRIKITTTATFRETKEKLTTYLEAQKIQDFISVNTGFGYDVPEIQSMMENLDSLPEWAGAAVPSKQYVAATTSNTGSWWRYFNNNYSDPSTYNQYMDLLLFANSDYNSATGVTRHDYDYSYIRNLSATGIVNLRVHLDPSQGPMTSTYNNSAGTEIYAGENATSVPVFPYNAKKGVLLTVSNTAAGMNITHNPLTYYTLPIESEFWPDITLGPYLNGGLTLNNTVYNGTQNTVYNNLRLYLTDDSGKSFKVTGGVTVTRGMLYTKRPAVLGGNMDDTGSTNRADIRNETSNRDLVFDTYSFVFASPTAQDAPLTQSVMQGNGGAGKMIMHNGSILIQNNHQLTIANGAEINANENKGIVIEPGGNLVIEPGAVITGNIYASAGSNITINGGSVTGNIYCSGNMTINGNFTLNQLNNADNVTLGYTGELSGIFIYNDTNIGVGTLTMDTVPVITGDSGNIHTFVPYDTGISDAQADAIFCDNHNEDTNACEHWLSEDYAWQPQIASTVREN